ncbi:ribonuclease R [Methylovulum psychrotolerans]|uniref:Ribonuclease R n=1 Tax=Methylovulum psychrotolerans TaxID=1704499 RepID=A0A1Z4C1B8_9GAMM|nr:ribonuclease R [Methylovulum psychrotolerans]ASF47332.1 ribonuclease R [Methylovulum psychrotolerans]POZ50851.1 ribonuclease R [Methylovulum psychrotolerans]
MPSKSKKDVDFSSTKDPYAQREAEKYENPIPSRELILQLIEHSGKPLLRKEIAEAFTMESEDQLEALRRRLRAMERDGQLLFNREQRYCLVNNKDLIVGRIIGHADGFGFIRPDDGSDDLFLSPREMNPLLHNDRAMVRIVGIDKKGRREGAVVEILERNTHQIVGRLYKEDGFTYVIPDNKNLSQTVLLQKDGVGKAKQGQIVIAEIVDQPTKLRQPIGRIIEVLGDHLAPGMEIEMAIRSHELPHRWPAELEEEIKQLSPEVPEAAKEGRVDLRDTPLVTIDGEDARDFDDAVFAKKTPKGWKLLVAIADVSHYVQINTALDNEAKNRSTSVYFPEKVIPMLPEILSNGLCSLNPHVDRLCMVCEMLIDGEGNVSRSRFFEAVMRSHARLTYTEVAKMLVEGDTELAQKHTALMPHLRELYALYKVMRVQREQRGAMDFDTQETRIVFGKNRKIEKIVPVTRNDAHKLIEEFMITANSAAARFLNGKKIPKLLRIHEGPSADKLLNLKTFLGELGLKFGGGAQPTPLDYMHLVEAVRHRPDAHLIQTVLLRSMSQAVYSPELKGHFGLALEAYAHFTSPIRRYPDLLVHRAIRHCLQGKNVASFFYGVPDMVLLGEHCSANERRADDATRDVVSWLKCEFMMDKIGEEFSGIISAVTSFGFFVELADIYVEGLVHISNLGQDYFHFDPTSHQLKGERTNTNFRLGDSVKIRVVRVDLDEKKMDFELVQKQASVKKADGGAPTGKPKRKRKKKPKSV